MELIEDLIKYGTAWLQLFKNSLKMFKLEVKLFHLSFIRVCVAVFLCCSLAVVAWIILLFILGYVSFYYTQNVLTAAIAVFLINGLIAAFVLVYLFRQLKNMRFKHSKAAFRSLINNRAKYENKNTETTDPIAKQ